MIATAPALNYRADVDREGLRVYLSARFGVDLDAAARALARSAPGVLTRARGLAEHDDLLDGMLACDDLLLAAHILAFVRAPDGVDLALA